MTNYWTNIKPINFTYFTSFLHIFKDGTWTKLIKLPLKYKSVINDELLANKRKWFT